MKSAAVDAAETPGAFGAGGDLDDPRERPREGYRRKIELPEAALKRRKIAGDRFVFAGRGKAVFFLPGSRPSWKRRSTCHTLDLAPGVTLPDGRPRLSVGRGPALLGMDGRN